MRSSPSMVHRVSLPLLTACCLLIGSSGEASVVRPVNLEQLSRRADRIFWGRCVSVRVTRDQTLAGQPVTFATFVPRRSAKGGVKGEVTVRMLGMLDGTDVRGRSSQGTPEFHEGEDVVLFLYPDSHRGLTSPVGFGQGKFVVAKDKAGRPLARNASGNESLFKRFSPEAERRLDMAGLGWRQGGAESLTPDALLDLVQVLESAVTPNR